jgi:hypothetical protein
MRSFDMRALVLATILTLMCSSTGCETTRSVGHPGESLRLTTMTQCSVEPGGLEPAPLPDQKYLYVYFSGLVQLLTKNISPGAWVLLPDAGNPTDYELEHGASVFQTPHYGHVFVKTGTVSGTLPSIDRCANHVDSRMSLPGTSITDREVSFLTGTTGTLTIDGSIALLADVDKLVKEILSADPMSMLSTTPDTLSTTWSSDLLARVVIDRGDLYVYKKWKCDGKTMFDFARHGRIDGADVDGEVSSVEGIELAASFVLRIPFDGEVTVQTRIKGSGTSTNVTIQPVNDKIELLIENSPDTSDCGHGDLHFAGHYFLSDSFDETGHVLLPYTDGRSSGAGDDAMCSPGGSDGKP